MRAMTDAEVSEGKELADEWLAKRPQLIPTNVKK
jgi:hypothetical protein